jgi:hypothetical protein
MAYNLTKDLNDLPKAPAQTLAHLAVKTLLVN